MADHNYTALTSVASSAAHAATNAPTEDVQDLTLGDTEYSVAIAAGTKAFHFQARQNVDIRFAYTTGKVATPTENYFTLKAGTSYAKSELNLTNALTLYLASATAGTDVEVIVWS